MENQRQYDMENWALDLINKSPIGRLSLIQLKREGKLRVSRNCGCKIYYEGDLAELLLKGYEILNHINKYGMKI